VVIDCLSRSGIMAHDYEHPTDIIYDHFRMIASCKDVEESDISVCKLYTNANNQ
jgi:hypothetical protein